MSSTGKLLSVAGLATLAVSAAFAQSLPPSVAACASEKDSLARLVCFDREVAKFTQPSARVAPTPAVPAVVSPPAATGVTAQPTAESPTADDFGVAGKLAQKRAAAKESVAPSVKELRATVTKLSAKPYGEVVMELDNGQVWEENEKKSSFVIKAGEVVVIKPAKFGSFMLTTDAGATTRVHRTH
ncbi:MAG: hypothetical protein WDO68_27570 [Gammaproteobacteria bacterium]